jgi:acyl carrier protein
MLIPPSREPEETDDFLILMETTFERLQRVLSEQCFVEKSQITPDTRMVRDLETDSLDAVEILMAIEEEWNVEIDDSRISQCAPDPTVSEIADLLDEYICKK